MRHRRKLSAFCVGLLFASMFIGTLSASSFFGTAWSKPLVLTAPTGDALYVKTPQPTGYGYIERDIDSIGTEAGNVYVFQAFFNILSFSPLPAGVVFQVNLEDNEGKARYSFRLTNDYGVLFYYPFATAQAVFKASKVWTVGSWCNLTTVVSGSDASFYANGNLVGSSNSTGFPAEGGGYVLSRISRFGEPDREKGIVECFADNVGFYENDKTIFFEDFEEGLGKYSVSKSADAVVETAKPSAFTTLILKADPTSASTGDYIQLSGKLGDVFRSGLGDRTIHLFYRTSEDWVGFGNTRTMSNGSFTYRWPVPYGLDGQILVKAEFHGDESYGPSVSNIVTITVKARPGIPVYMWYLLLSIAIVLISSIVVIKRRILVGRLSPYIFLIAAAVNLFFTFLALVNYLRIPYYLSYTMRVVQIVIFSGDADLALRVASLFLMLASLFLSKYRAHIVVPRSFFSIGLLFLVSTALLVMNLREIGSVLLFLASVAALAVGVNSADALLGMSRVRATVFLFAVLFGNLNVVEIGSAAVWIYNIFEYQHPLVGSGWELPFIDVNIFSILYPATPLLLLAFLFSWIWLPVSGRVRRLLGIRKHRSRKMPVKKTEKHLPREDFMGWVGKLVPTRLVLLLSVFFSFLIGYAPYFTASPLVGIDSRYYVDLLTEMSESLNPWKVLVESGFARYRPAFFVFAYFVKLISGQSSLAAIRVMPAIIASLLCIAVYFFVKQGTGNTNLAGLSAIFTVFSFNTTVGMYAAILSNWFSIIILVLFFGFMLRAERIGSKRFWSVAMLISVVLLFTHVWTWGIFIATMLGYVALRLVCRDRSGSNESFHQVFRKSIVYGIGVISLNLCVVLALFLASSFTKPFPGLGWVSEMAYGLLSGMFSQLVHFDLFKFWNDIVFTIQMYVGGYYGNPLLMALAICGMISLRRAERGFRDVLLSWTLVTSIIFVVMVPDELWRVLYVVPFQFLAPLGLCLLINFTRRLWRASTIYLDAKILGVFEVELLLLILLLMFNYALRSVSFLPLRFQ